MVIAIRSQKKAGEAIRNRCCGAAGCSKFGR